MRLPTLECYEAEEDQEEASKYGKYTLQVRIRLLEAL
jgi:hypothetical protein